MKSVKPTMPLAIMLAAIFYPAQAQEYRQVIGQIAAPSVSTITLRGAPYTREIDDLVQRGIEAAAKTAPDLHVDYRSALLINDRGKLTLGLSLVPKVEGTAPHDMEFLLVSTNHQPVHAKAVADIRSRQVRSLVLKEPDGNGVELSRAENRMYRIFAKEASHAEDAAPGTVGCIKQGLADAFKPCEAGLLLNEVRACVVLLANTPDTLGISDLFAVAPCLDAAKSIVEALACAGIDCLFNGGSNPAPQINDVNPKVIPVGVNTLLTLDAKDVQPNFSALVKVGGQTFPIYPGSQTIYVNQNRVLLWVYIGGAASTTFSVQIVNPDGQQSNEFVGLGASSGQQGGNQGNTQLQISFMPNPVGPASTADCSRAYFFTVVVQNTGNMPVTFSRLDVDGFQNLSLSQVGFPDQIGPSSQFQSGITYCRDAGSTTWTLNSTSGAAWSGTAQLLQ